MIKCFIEFFVIVLDYIVIIIVSNCEKIFFMIDIYNKVKYFIFNMNL